MNTSRTGDLSEIHEKSQLAIRNKVELLTFEIGDKEGIQFAINVFKVKEIVMRSAYEITKIAGMENKAVIGMISHRDGIIPIVSLIRWVEGTECDPDRDDKIVICQYNKRVVGFLVGGDSSIIRRDWKEILENDYLRQGGKINNITKTTEEKPDGTKVEKVVYILDVESLLDDIMPQVDQEHLASEVQEKVKERLGKILVADDSPTARNHVRRIFEQIGVSDSSFYENGSLLLDGLSTIDPAKVGLVITDLEMPEKSGFTVIKEIRENERTKDLPIVVNSSMSGENNVREAMSLGANGFIAKTDIAEVARTVMEHCRRV